MFDENLSDDFEIQEALRSFYKLANLPSTYQFLDLSFSDILLATYFDITRKTGKNHFVFAKEPLECRLNELGCLFESAPLSAAGFVNAQNVAESISARTALLSLPAIDPETGVLNTEIKEIATLCKERDILFHLDITEALGKVDLDFSEADILTFDAKKIGRGVFMRETVELTPVFENAFDHQLFILRGKAAEEAYRLKGHFALELALLKAYFEERVGEKVLFEESLRAPHIASIKFNKLHNDALHYLLQEKKIYTKVRSDHESLVFHFDSNVTKEDVERAVLLIREASSTLREYSEAL